MDLNTKIIYGLERLADAFKTLIWDKAKLYGISPIQIQILLFIANHNEALCSVSHLAKEFNVTKPTVSDAVKVLHKKEYLEKSYSSEDSRSYTLFLTAEGKSLIEDIAEYAFPIKSALNQSGSDDLSTFYTTLTELIHGLNKRGVLQVQRSCYSCRFYEANGDKHYCKLLEKTLADTEIRLDCNEHQVS